MDRAADRKLETLEASAALGRKDGYVVQVFSFAVGACGTWHGRNEPMLTALGVPAAYKTIFRQLAVAMAIRGTRDVYLHHLTGVNQRDNFPDHPANRYAARQQTP